MRIGRLYTNRVDNRSAPERLHRCYHGAIDGFERLRERSRVLQRLEFGSYRRITCFQFLRLRRRRIRTHWFLHRFQFDLRLANRGVHFAPLEKNCCEEILNGKERREKKRLEAEKQRIKVEEVTLAMENLKN